MSPRAAASSRCHLAYLGGALPTELPRQGLAENLIWPGQRGAIELPRNGVRRFRRVTSGQQRFPKPCVGGSIPPGGTDSGVWFRLTRDVSCPSDVSRRGEGRFPLVREPPFPRCSEEVLNGYVLVVKRPGFRNP
jgi:hypothetical protein